MNLKEKNENLNFEKRKESERNQKMEEILTETKKVNKERDLNFLEIGRKLKKTPVR